MTDWVDDVVKELAKETADYTKPEMFTKWCREMSSRLKLDVRFLYTQVYQRLRKIHSITYLDSLQKVQLMFVLRQRVNPCFLFQILKEGHRMVLENKSKRIMSFRSKDGKFVRCGKDKARYFQGVPIKRENRGSDQDDDDSLYGVDSILADNTLPNATLANEPSTSGAYRPPADDSVTEQKPIKFGGPGTPNFPVFAYSPAKEEPIGEIDYEHNDEGAPSTSRNIQEEQIQVPVEDRTSTAREEEPIFLTPQQRRKAMKYMDENYKNGATMQQVRSVIKRFARSASAEDRDQGIEAAPPAREETPSSSKRRQEESAVMEAKRSKSSGVQNSEPIRRYITLSEDDDIIVVPETASYSTAPSTSTAPYSRVSQNSETQEASQISALKLVEQIEMIAHFLNLHDLKTKAARIAQELQLEDKTICPKKFHREVLSIWASVDDAKLKTYDGGSMDVKKFLESLRLSVIRPLGRKMVADSLMYIEKKIKKVDEKKSQRVLPMEKIKENLESLLALAIIN